MKQRFLLLASILLTISILLAWWSDHNRPTPIALIPSLTGQTEYCLTCHSDLPEISASHPLKTFGCVICHGGERLALNADLAHSSMRGGQNPSDLTVVEQSCGGEKCHSGSAVSSRDHIQRVMTSVQSTYAGAIAIIRYTFGAQPDLKARFGSSAVSDANITTLSGVASLQKFDPATETNPTIRIFADNCLNCHINATPRPGSQYSRLTGCAACHTPGFNPTADKKIHTLTTSIPFTQCNTCHNRGNYDLRTMNFVERSDQASNRLQNYYQPIAQFTRCEYTLDCIDCHTRVEVMGDGDIHSNKTEIQYIQCKTCHGTLTELPLTKTITDPNDIALRQATLNPVVDLQVGSKVLVTDQGEPLWNTRVLPDGTYQLIGKATRQLFSFRPVMGSQCKQKPDQQASKYCHECHAVNR